LKASSLLSHPSPIASDDVVVKRSSNSNLFYYDSALDDVDARSSTARNANGNPNIRIDPRLTYETVSLSSRQFIEALEKQHTDRSSPTHYFTAPLTSPSFLPFLRFHMPKYRASLSPFFPSPPSRLSPSLWVGGLSTATQTHYDVHDNVLTQLSGRKRVRVWAPPGPTPMFPDSDPRARKAQTVLEDGGGGAGAPEPILDVVLEHPSGVFIPAFFPHHCEVVSDPETSSVSVSLNAFAQSETGTEAAAVLAEISRHPEAGEAAVFRLLGGDPERAGAARQTTHDRYSALLGLSPSALPRSASPSDRGGPDLPPSLEVALGAFEPGHEAIKDLIACHALEIMAVAEAGGARSPETLIDNIRQIYN